MSLQDQLLKAGLVNKQQAKQARASKRKKRKQGGVDDNAVLKQEVLEKRQTQALKEKQLNQQKYEKELAIGRIRSLQTELPKAAIEIPKFAELEYNFTFEFKVLKLFVTEELKHGLINGQLGIVRFSDNNYLVPNKLVARVAEVKPEWVAYIYDGEQTDDIQENDPYADYQIPDDLMW